MTKGTEAIIIKTFLKVDQNLFNAGQKVPLDRRNMYQ